MRCALRRALVGATGLEPAASWSQTKHSTKLSYAPVFWHYYYTLFREICQVKKLYTYLPAICGVLCRKLYNILKGRS